MRVSATIRERAVRALPRWQKDNLVFLAVAPGHRAPAENSTNHLMASVLAKFKERERGSLRLDDFAR